MVAQELQGCNWENHVVCYDIILQNVPAYVVLISDAHFHLSAALRAEFSLLGKNNPRQPHK